MFAEHYDLRADGLRSDVIDTRYNTDGTTFSQTKVNWTYDGVDRLTSEALTVLAGGSNAPAAYTNVFKFDLSNNRTEEDVTGNQTATITYTYNSDNELGVETRTGSGAYQTTDTYDTAGNLIGQVRTGTNPETDSYVWDIRGRMKSATVSGTATTYTYDSDGVRTSESTGTTHTYYLNDPNNPTGYTKAVEESATKGGTPSRSYILGYSVEGQSDSTNSTLFLLHDAHGSTRALLNVSGGIAEQYNYDAYGTLLASTGAQSSSALAKTRWLFGGDGLYDPGSGWTYQLARYRNGSHFVSYDPRLSALGDLANANLYVYCGGNPINLRDPTGHFSTSELGVSNGLAMVLDALFLPTTTLQGFAIRAVIGAAIYGVKELFIQHYYIAVADALDHLANVLSPVNNSWAGALKKQALGLRSDAVSQRVLAVAQAIAPQFAGSHVSIILGAVLGTSAYYDAKREVVDIENEASTAISRFTGLNIQLSIDPDVLVKKFLSRDLDPAKDINLVADAISFGLAGDIPKAASSMGALLTHLKQQYPITVSGTFFNTSWSVHV